MRGLFVGVISLVVLIVNVITRLLRPETSAVLFQSTRDTFDPKIFRSLIQQIDPSAKVSPVGYGMSARIGDVAIKVKSNPGIMDGANRYTAANEAARYAIATHLGWTSIVGTAPRRDMAKAQQLVSRLAARLANYSHMTAVWTDTDRTVYAIDDIVLARLSGN